MFRKYFEKKKIQKSFSKWGKIVFSENMGCRKKSIEVQEEVAFQKNVGYNGKFKYYQLFINQHVVYSPLYPPTFELKITIRSFKYLIKLYI